MDSVSRQEAVAGAAATSATEGAASRTFTRKASGVAKALSPFDSYAYNTIVATPIGFSATSFLFILGFWPQANLPLGILLAALVTLPLVVTQALLQTAMPRTGGDYVFTSRTLNGGIAVSLDLGNWSVIAAMWIPVVGWTISTQILAPMLTILGFQWGSSGLQSVADFFSSTGGVILWSFIGMGFALLLAIYPFKVFAKVQRYFYWIGLVPLIVVCVYMAVKTSSSFVSTLNENALKFFDVKDAYNTVLSRATEAGFDGNTSFSFGQTWSALTVFMYAVMYCVWSSGNAGEIRDKGSFRSKLMQMGGALATCLAIGAAVGFVATNTFGHDFLSAASYLWYNAPDQYPFPVAPMWAFFASIMGGAWVAVTALLAVFVWQFFSVTNNVIYSSRLMFAMSQDRVFFKLFGRISSRTHTPLNGILLILSMAVVLTFLYAYTSFSTLLYSVVLLQVVAWMASSAGGALWPFLKRDMYQATEIQRYKVAGIPLITISGTLFFIGGAYIIYQCLTDPAIGVASNRGYWFNGGVILLGIVTYVGFKWYNKRKESIDVSLAYKEIPPE